VRLRVSGDLAAAARHLTDPVEPADDLSRFACTLTALVQAQLDTARGDVIAAAGHLRQAVADLSSRPGLLLQLPATAAGLVRTALAAGDTELAARLARAAETLAAGHPGYPVVRAVAAHSRGLIAAGPARLPDAAGQHPDRWARASAEEDLGVLLARQGERGQAISRPGQAIEGYESTEAAADAARVRRRLRKLGVRRRHWGQWADRPVAGWESLTETEHRVSELVAQGACAAHGHHATDRLDGVRRGDARQAGAEQAGATSPALLKGHCHDRIVEGPDRADRGARQRACPRCCPRRAG
jgi:hypothetical protein